MAYRSLKRVLGETSLERKCRLLFGSCLLLLITGAFTWVDRIAETLVVDITRNKGRDLVDMVLLKRHFETWETQLRFKALTRELVEDIVYNNDYRHEILALDDGIQIANLRAQPPRDNQEAELLKALKVQLKEQATLIAEREKAAQRPNELLDDPEKILALADDLPPVYQENVATQENAYHYFEAINWKTSCKRCHPTHLEAGAVPPSEGSTLASIEPPLRVIKVIIPYRETQNAINRARAILIAVAILTVFMSMIVLYVIVRYVVVKPLKHLRDVSDDISRGKTEMRAEIHTNDEFEELAASFNRMLRHLTDTQGELRQVNIDLDNKVDELAQLNMRLYEMNRLKGDFLANMSHELRTPLNSIIGFSEVLEGIDSLTDKQKRYARNIQKSGRVLLEMINDILDLAKMEAGKMEVRPTEFHPHAVIHAQCDMVRSLTEERNIDLEVEVDPNLPMLYQDQAKIQQILTNLLSNAIKFTPEGGRITVSAKRQGDQLQLSVADTGVGIAEEDREIIFQKFRQGTEVLGGDSLTREYSGTGLGLSILKELSKLLGGEIDFTSELGIGSTFVVTLPWNCVPRSPRESPIATKLDELTRPHAADLLAIESDAGGRSGTES